MRKKVAKFFVVKLVVDLDRFGSLQNAELSANTSRWLGSGALEIVGVFRAAFSLFARNRRRIRPTFQAGILPQAV